MKMYTVLNWAPDREEVWSSGGIATRILNLGPRYRWSASHHGRFIPLPPGADVGAVAKRKKFPARVGNGTPVAQPVV
jgi:hypothetical protein